MTKKYKNNNYHAHYIKELQDNNYIKNHPWNPVNKGIMKKKTRYTSNLFATSTPQGGSSLSNLSFLSIHFPVCLWQRAVF